MHTVTQIIFNPDHPNLNSAMWIGGEQAYIQEWPLNPEGHPLLHLFSINSSKLLQHVHVPYLPPDMFISVFSTYSASEYFLDQVTYTGDELEWNENILAGCTYVSVTPHAQTSLSPTLTIPISEVNFVETQLAEQDFPAFSFFSSTIPNGVNGIGHLLTHYQLVCQIYSADFPAPYKDILGLSDASGYLFLRKGPASAEAPLDGLFFVQTS
ncbi:hypothetical protein [Paenibacillus sp. MABNR03]|uniref:hypothetical protein n=1 Tax=Paenibacillus sp. MABNR03 TaxID=3142626 RepID=UPI003D27A80E